MDSFSPTPRRVDGAVTSARAVTPSDTAGIETPRSLYIGGGGNLRVRNAADSSDVTFQDVPAGALLNIRPSFIRATGTTATGILALS